MNDLISRQAAIDALGERPMVWTDDDQYALGERSQYDRDRIAIGTLPSAQPEQKDGKWTTEQVAELLANMFGEECACNFNGIDEWLPSACKYSETTCPNPKEKHGCWMQFLIQGGADMRGDYNEKPM